ncbi:MAG: type II secretion system F family protein [Candidatus Riflebacteria bacterium]|nr:type II secretion system F family protein [Candidatus Riflebacteria bacterium]
MYETLVLIVLPFTACVGFCVAAAPYCKEWFESREGVYQEWLDEELWDKTTGRQLAGYCVISALGHLLVGYVIFGGFVVPILTMFLGYWVPIWVMRYLIFKRHQLLEEQLEVGLTNLANSMRAGLTFVQSLKEASRNLPPPISEEFALIAKEYELGKSLDEALEHSKHRFKSVNYNLAVLSILVSRQQGGNLSETLERISAFMREVFAIDRKIKVMTAEGRFSAKVIGVSPFFMGAMLYLGAPQYMKPLFTDPLGGFILFLALILNLIGFAWIQKIVQINV